MASTLTLKRQTTFAIELMFVLRISMLPRDDTQNERNNKKRLSGCPREPILGSYRRWNNLNHRRQLNYTTNSRYLRVFLTSVGRIPDLAALDTLREIRFAHLRKKTLAAEFPGSFLVKPGLKGFAVSSIATYLSGPKSNFSRF
jgi:hypothetical protein